MAAKLLSSSSHIITGKLKVSELFFEVPVNYAEPASESLRLFARTVQRHETPIDPVKDEKPEKKQLPWFAYLEGGPGGACRPAQQYAWLQTVLDKGYQVIFMDQRGTGLSTPVTAGTLVRKGNAVKQADYLTHFRADNIVRDCEAIRKCLTTEYPEEKKKWSVMGQSYGGFCSLTYLSFFSEGLREVFTCGGLAPLVDNPDPVYKRTYQNVIKRNKAYYAKYPEDGKHINRILKYLGENEITLPTGGTLTPSRFMQQGIHFGFQGGLDDAHNMVFRFINDLDLFGELTRPSLAAMEASAGFDTGVIYAILHESIYCQGQKSDWSADRLLSNFAEFRMDSEQPFFTGEMIYKEMFDSFSELRPLKETANILAKIEDWPALYDEEQLAKNTVPVYSASYVDDMYVTYSFASDTASKVNGCKEFITNMMYHDATRLRAADLMRNLFFLREDLLD